MFYHLGWFCSPFDFCAQISIYRFGLKEIAGYKIVSSQRTMDTELGSIDNTLPGQLDMNENEVILLARHLWNCAFL